MAKCSTRTARITVEVGKETNRVIKRKATIFSLTLNFTFSIEQNIYFLY